MTAFQSSPPVRPLSLAAGFQKVRVGPVVSVAFEDRQSLWLRMQELMRFARSTNTGVDRQLDWYRRLMPEPGRWPAAVWLGRPGSRTTLDLTDIRTTVATGRFVLRSSAGHELVADHLPHRHTDRHVGLIGWIEFRHDADLETVYCDSSLIWHLHLDAVGYQHRSAPLVRIRTGFLPA